MVNVLLICTLIIGLILYVIMERFERDTNFIRTCIGFLILLLFFKI